MRESLFAGARDKTIWKRLQKALKALRCESPVIMREIVDFRVHRGSDYKHTARSHNRIYLFYSLPRVLYVLECSYGDCSADGFGQELDVMKVYNHVNPEAFSHVSANIFLARKERPKVGRGFLPRHTKCPKLINGFRNRQCFSTNLYKFS